MRKIIVAQFLTLDGVAQAPGAKDEDLENGFKYGGWQVPFFGDEDGEIMSYAFDNMGAMLLGRKTYDIFASYWPNVGKGQELVEPDDTVIATIMNETPKYVASHADSLMEWENGNVTHLKDVAKEINELKQQDGKHIIVWGSGDFVQTLMREHLVDEYFLLVHPLVLGSGKKLFIDGSAKQDLELISSKTTKNGVLVLNYQVK